MKLTTLEQAFVEELKDIYSAEQQLLEALPEMVKAASNSELKAGFKTHLAQTKEHVTRIEHVFGLLEEKPTAHTCQAMKGLLKEGKEIIEEDAENNVHDALLIAAAQKVEHYEIATYGTLCTWARHLEREDIKTVLGQTLAEEEETDKILTALAQKSINAKAV